MLKVSFLAAMLLAQSNTAPMAQKMEAACTGTCHGPSLIAQQRLDRGGWTREVEKMMRWGAQVEPADKDALINYLTSLFNSSRPRPNTSKTLPDGRGKDVFQVSCMSCHDESPVTALRRDRAAWNREVDKMIQWGAYVPASRKDELIDYIMSAFSK
jgi:hypothetical protein